MSFCVTYKLIVKIIWDTIDEQAQSTGIPCAFVKPWEKHGAFAIDETVSDAFDMIDILSKSAQIWFMDMRSGNEPKGLNDEQLMELKEAFLKK